MNEHVERARSRYFSILFRFQELEDAFVAADEVVAPGVVVGVDGRVRVGVEVEVLGIVWKGKRKRKRGVSFLRFRVVEKEQGSEEEERRKTGAGGSSSFLTLYCSRSRFTRRSRGGEPSVEGLLRIAMTVS